ncbi:hypothetical protein [Microbispora sp. ATCC PTA-5024]|uniref:hypothetical protein n=1 Tax=Microbispora sp. ATCC PTA-5024 TaxID=316330 RepID=UPI0012ED4336|nr:hypothetical protein [Microbispora sp. ATCC PTA-5024]
MDPLSFPVLAGAALNQAFGFLFGRLAHLLDNRGNKSSEPEQVETPEVVEGNLEPVQTDVEALEKYINELEALSGALGVYQRNPERIRSEDQNLLSRLGRLRQLLEVIYNQRITFQGELRSSTGASVRQHMQTAAGEVTGVDGKRVRRADVVQDINRSEQGSKIIGIKGEDIG